MAFSWIQDGAQSAAFQSTLASVARKQPVHLNDYLPAGFVSGVTDCTDAITNWGEAAQAVGDVDGAVVMVAAPGVYKFTVPISGIMMTFTDIGLQIDAEAATFADQQTYTGTQTARFIRHINCRQVREKMRITSQDQFDTVGETLPVGLIGLEMRQGTTIDEIDLVMNGGREGVSCVKVKTDPDSYKVRGGKISVRTTGVFYAYAGQFSGCDSDVHIDADTPGRAFIIYGVENVKIHCRSKNQSLTSNLSGYGSQGCSNIEIWFYDRESTVNTFGVSMMWRRDVTSLLPVTHRNIKIHYDCYFTGTDARALLLQKDLTDTDSTDDSTARGHVLDGLTVDGYLEYTGGSVINLINHGSAGELVVGDFMRNINFDGLIIKDIGTQRALCNFNAKALVDTCRVNGLTSTSSFKVGNQGNGKVLHTGCVATWFSTDALDVHDYVACSATGASQVAPGTTKKSIRSSGTNMSPPSTYTATNVTPDRTYDANATTTDELADVLGTLIADLRAAGIVV